MAELLLCSGEKTSSADRFVEGYMKEVAVVNPNIRSLGSEFFHHGFEQSVSVLESVSINNLE